MGVMRKYTTENVRIYLAGPMTGIAEFNFPLFDRVSKQLRDRGYYVISPAEMDRANGFDEKGKTGNEYLPVLLRQQFARQDIESLLMVDWVVLLPGWKDSTGATNEASIATMLGLPLFEWVDVGNGNFALEKIPPLPVVFSGKRVDADVVHGTAEKVETYVGGEVQQVIEANRLSDRASLLREAEQLVTGDRNAQYGDPRQDFERTAWMWSAYLGVEVQPHDVAAMMIALKLSRIRWSPDKRDSWADAAGYAACGYEARPESYMSDGAGEVTS